MSLEFLTHVHKFLQSTIIAKTMKMDSLLAAHVPEQHVPDVPIFQDPRIVRGDDDHHEPSDGGSDESEDSQLPEQCIILH